MPIYEYRCTSCGAELEKLQKISDPPLVQCPECGNDALVKLVSASSFRLKGSGWYETDFKTGKKKNGAGDADASSGGAASGTAKAGGGEATSGSADGAGGSTSSGTATESKQSAGAGKSDTASKSAPKE
ncbi:MAG: FmdB family zinc ribbon protein [Gammaproteobacteria bacterium]